MAKEVIVIVDGVRYVPESGNVCYEGPLKSSIEQVYQKPLKDLRIPEGYELVMAGAIPCFRPVAKGDWFLAKLGDCAMYSNISLPNDSRLILRQLFRSV